MRRSGVRPAVNLSKLAREMLRFWASGHSPSTHASKRAAAWRMADAPADYLTGMLANIVAFRIEVRRVIAKAKLSQNREPADFAGVVESLEARGRDGMAARMRRIAEARD